jgi:predicted nucleotidyltransferase
MNKAIFETELKQIAKISKEFGAKKVFLFGSCIEDIKTANDIDIAVSGIKPKDFFKFYGKVSMALKDEVDIIDMADIRKHLYNKILSTGKAIYERPV